MKKILRTLISGAILLPTATLLMSCSKSNNNLSNFDYDTDNNNDDKGNNNDNNNDDGINNSNDNTENSHNDSTIKNLRDDLSEFLNKVNHKYNINFAYQDYRYSEWVTKEYKQVDLPTINNLLNKSSKTLMKIPSTTNNAKFEYKFEFNRSENSVIWDQQLNNIYKFTIKAIDKISGKFVEESWECETQSFHPNDMLSSTLASRYVTYPSDLSYIGGTTALNGYISTEYLTSILKNDNIKISTLKFINNNIQNSELNIAISGSFHNYNFDQHPITINYNNDEKIVKKIIEELKLNTFVTSVDLSIFDLNTHTSVFYANKQDILKHMNTVLENEYDLTKVKFTIEYSSSGIGGKSIGVFVSVRYGSASDYHIIRISQVSEMEEENRINGAENKSEFKAYENIVNEVSYIAQGSSAHHTIKTDISTITEQLRLNEEIEDLLNGIEIEAPELGKKIYLYEQYIKFQQNYDINLSFKFESNIKYNTGEKNETFQLSFVLVVSTVEGEFISESTQFLLTYYTNTPEILRVLEEVKNATNKDWISTYTNEEIYHKFQNYMYSHKRVFTQDELNEAFGLNLDISAIKSDIFPITIYASDRKIVWESDSRRYTVSIHVGNFGDLKNYIEFFIIPSDSD